MSAQVTKSMERYSADNADDSNERIYLEWSAELIDKNGDAGFGNKGGKRASRESMEYASFPSVFVIYASPAICIAQALWYRVLVKANPLQQDET